jgi:beta-fructofuranosidase
MKTSPLTALLIAGALAVHPGSSPAQNDPELDAMDAGKAQAGSKKTIPELKAATDQYHHLLAEDFHRPLWHLGSLDANWWDVNGLGYFDGRYHAMFMKSGHWGHAVSHDLLHWRFLPDSITHGMFSDGRKTPAFSGDMIDNAPQPTLIFYSKDRGICIAIAKDNELREWELLTGGPVIPKNGETAKKFPEAVIFDPMGWYDEKEATYYALIGNRSRTPGYEGDGTSLFKTKDLLDWEYIGPLYKSRRDMTESYEDSACADFFPLNGKWVLIAHLHETWTHVRWYVGSFDGTTFTPETMGRLSYLHHQMAAPETFLDGQGRRIFFGHHRTASVTPGLWNSNFSLPAVLSIGPDNALRFAPAEELTSLRHTSRTFEPMTLNDSMKRLEHAGARSIELRARIVPGTAEAVGFRVAAAPDDSEFTDITYLPKEGVLEFDFSKSDLKNRVTYTRHRPGPKTLNLVGENPPVKKQRIPFKVPDGEDLDLHVFVDGCIIEVIANNRTLATQNVYPSRRDSVEVRIFARGGKAEIKSLEAHQLKTTMNL